MNTTALFDGLDVDSKGGSQSTRVSGICIDTRKIEEGELFVALEGSRTDGHDYLSDAINKGASAILIESDKAFNTLPTTDTPVYTTSSTFEILPEILIRFYGDPSEDLSLIGVTGTNGKTTTTYLIRSILEAEGESTGLIGTIESRFGSDTMSSECTTPSIVDSYKCLQRWTEKGASAVVMEVSSHGLDQGRVRGLSYTAGAFTNLSQDHLDYHGDMESYFQAKKKLFDQSNIKVTYSGDSFGSRLVDEYDAISVGEDDAEYTIHNPRVGIRGIELTLNTPTGSIELTSPLTGLFNYKNIAIAAALGCELGIKPDVVKTGIENCESIPGRCERLDGPPAVVIDYAHTPEAMENVLQSFQPITDGQLLCVFGAGGDRDRGKRPKMGHIGVEAADYSVITSDNPRSEDPDRIINDILEGVGGRSNYHVEVDRGQAIRDAIERANDEDIVLVIGKGHETEQVIGDQVIPFEDRTVAKEILEYQNE